MTYETEKQWCSGDQVFYTLFFFDKKQQEKRMRRIGKQMEGHDKDQSGCYHVIEGDNNAIIFHSESKWIKLNRNKIANCKSTNKNKILHHCIRNQKKLSKKRSLEKGKKD